MAHRILEDVLRRLRTEYLVTPDLLLTPGEAAALMNLDRATVVTLLETLEDAQFLELTPDGRFGLADDHQRTAVSQSALGRRRAV